MKQLQQEVDNLQREYEKTIYENGRTESYAMFLAESSGLDSEQTCEHFGLLSAIEQLQSELNGIEKSIVEYHHRTNLITNEPLRLRITTMRKDLEEETIQSRIQKKRCELYILLSVPYFRSKTK
jgi:hypothetical protein